ncbi:MAG: hypothetical protein IPP93_01060 [Chitinophagaceae bacterium]|nr:hypothetical protein [Chitinophagaceae bacterium]
MIKKLSLPFFACFPAIFFACLSASAQMITGTWHGKINRQKAEVKIIQSGDSLKGTAYYYESAGNYRRYSIKGYFDPETNSAVWWDDQLLDEKSSRFSISSPGKIPLLSRADFNCPGSGRMMLDGKAVKRENEESGGDLHLDKVPDPVFEDEWDFIIDNYTVGANDPYLIDSVSMVAGNPQVQLQSIPEEPVVVVEKPKPPPPPPVVIETVPVKENPVIVVSKPPPPPVTIQAPPAIVEKFKQREKKFTMEIPVQGDTLELRFYDNAEVDGDSIALFLDNKLIFQHIRLTGAAYIIKIPVDSLSAVSELTMVAENLGSIPPNTSYMVALMGEKRYDAYLASTEGSSAMIRLKKAVKPE